MLAFQYTAKTSKTYIAICQHNKIVSLNVHKSQDEEAPAVFDKETPPFLEAVFVDGVRGVDDVEQDIVKEGLEGGNRGALVREQSRECVCRGDANSED